MGNCCSFAFALVCYTLWQMAFSFLIAFSELYLSSLKDYLYFMQLLAVACRILGPDLPTYDNASYVWACAEPQAGVIPPRQSPLVCYYDDVCHPTMYYFRRQMTWTMCFFCQSVCPLLVFFAVPRLCLVLGIRYTRRPNHDHNFMSVTKIFNDISSNLIQSVPGSQFHT